MNSERGEAEAPELDPWGLNQVERLLTGLEGITSLKLVPDDQGAIDEVHVVSDGQLRPKQIVRNIESALLAEFGLQIDHRKISVASMPEEGVKEQEPTAPLDVAPRRRGGRWLLLDGVQIDRKAGQRATCRIVLSDGEDEFAGEAEGPDFAQSRLEVAARAVLEALDEATLEDIDFRVEGVKRFRTSGRDLVVAVIQGQERRRTITLAGVSLVEDSPEEASVLACLHATNRWAEAT